MNIQDDHLTQNPTFLNTKELGRLMLLGGNQGYRSSNKVYYVDASMNNLIKHSKMLIGKVGHSALLLRNKDLIVIGGYNSDKNEWLKGTEVCQDAFEEPNP